MNLRRRSRFSKIPFCAFAAVQVLAFLGASLAFTQEKHGQFGAPRFPEVRQKRDGKKPQSGAQAKEEGPQEPPELSAISPDSAPRGATAEFVLTGSNFVDGMNFRIFCKEGDDPEVQELEVESPNRALAKIRVPRGAKEGQCALYLENSPGPSFTVTQPAKKR